MKKKNQTQGKVSKAVFSQKISVEKSPVCKCIKGIVYEKGCVHTCWDCLKAGRLQ